MSAVVDRGRRGESAQDGVEAFAVGDAQGAGDAGQGVSGGRGVADGLVVDGCGSVLRNAGVGDAGEQFGGRLGAGGCGRHRGVEGRPSEAGIGGLRSPRFPGQGISDFLRRAAFFEPFTLNLVGRHISQGRVKPDLVIP